MLYLCNYSVDINESTIRTETPLFPRRFKSNLMIPACLVGMIMVGRIVYNGKNSFKLRFDKQISRNLLRKYVYKRLRRTGVACIHNVTFAPLVTPLTS